MEQQLTVKTYVVECPNRHTAGSYKTAIALEELAVFCEHCGTKLKVSN